MVPEDYEEASGIYYDFEEPFLLLQTRLREFNETFDFDTFANGDIIRREISEALALLSKLETCLRLLSTRLQSDEDKVLKLFVEANFD